MTVKPYNTGQTKKEEVRGNVRQHSTQYDLLNIRPPLSTAAWCASCAATATVSWTWRPVRATGDRDNAAYGTCMCWASTSRKRCSTWRAARSPPAASTSGSCSMGDAEHLRVSDASVDVVTVAFGVRNARRPGGRPARDGPHNKTGARSLYWSSRPQQPAVRVLYTSSI